jgi:hypothetical protein
MDMIHWKYLVLICMTSEPDGLPCFGSCGSDHRALSLHAGTQGAVSIIRLSGQTSVDIAQQVFRPSGRRQDNWRPQSHRVYHGLLQNTAGQLIDEACKGQPMLQIVPFISFLNMYSDLRLEKAQLQAG